jgi:hypothetical protein
LFLLPSWFFVDAGEHLVMADDVTTPSNPPVSLVEKEELEETPLDVKVSQWSREEESSRKMVAFESIVRHGIIGCLLTHMF